LSELVTSKENYRKTQIPENRKKKRNSAKRSRLAGSFKICKIRNGIKTKDEQMASA